MSVQFVQTVGPLPTLDPPRPFTALVVDKHAYVREAMAVKLRQVGANEVTEAASPHEVRIRAHAQAPPDLCLLELGLVAGDEHLLRELATAGWRRILLLSVADPVALRAAFGDGVRGYLVTPAAALAAGPAVRPSSVSTRRTYRLSGREIEVLKLVSDGRSNRDAGIALRLSSLTVKSHLARIARKLGTGDRAQMVFIALQAGVIS